MDVEETGKAVSFLGFTAPAEKVQKICEEADIDCGGSLDEGEFLMCLRKINEYEMICTRETFAEMDEDGSGGIDHDELDNVLRSLGYRHASRDAIFEVFADIGIASDADLFLPQFFIFLHAYRFREGFTKQAADEFEEALTTYAHGVAGEATSLEVGAVARGLGYATTWDLHQHLVAEVDIDRSGELDVVEIRKIVRRYHERDLWWMEKKFHECDADHDDNLTVEEALKGLEDLDCKASAERLKAWEEDDDGIDLKEFMDIAVDLSWQRRNKVKANLGFTEEEVKPFRAEFDMYATWQGYLLAKDVKGMIQDLFPDVWLSTDVRQGLIDILEPHVQEDSEHHLEFTEFLELCRQVANLREADMMDKENRAVLMAGFGFEEVEHFREIYLGHEDDFLLERPSGLTFDEVRKLMSDLSPAGSRRYEELKKCMNEVNKIKEIKRAACPKHTIFFPAFLMLMRALLEIGFMEGREPRQPKIRQRSKTDHYLQAKTDVSLAVADDDKPLSPSNRRASRRKTAPG